MDGLNKNNKSSIKTVHFVDGLDKNSKSSIKAAHFVDGLVAAKHRGQKKRTKWTETTYRN